MHALVMRNEMSSLENIRPGINPLFLSQKINAKEPQKKKISTMVIGQLQDEDVSCPGTNPLFLSQKIQMQRNHKRKTSSTVVIKVTTELNPLSS